MQQSGESAKHSAAMFSQNQQSQPYPSAPSDQPPPYSSHVHHASASPKVSSQQPSAPNIGIQVPQLNMSPPTIIYTTTSFGPYPQRFTCQHCGAHIMTETNSKPGLLTYLLSGAICLLAWYTICCCCVPFCIRECQDIEHQCPNCKQKLGLFKRL